VFNQRGAVGAVYRLIPEKIRTFGELGLPPVLANLADRPRGLVLITGPTGSGKSTTLAAMLDKINSERHEHILTIEDPIEYIHQHKNCLVNQREVHSDTNSFGNALRAALREDPDIVLIGEMRDLETAESAIQSSLTGHLVFSTLHTNDAPSAFTRLIDMGVEPFLVGSTVEGVMAQRLVRTICSECKIEYVPEPKDVPADFPRPGKAKGPHDEEGPAMDLELGQPLKLWKGAGCRACRQTGFRGRAGIFELMVTSDTIRDMCVQRVNSTHIRNQAIKEGMVTLRKDGWRKVLSGMTTIEEVARVTAGDIVM
jgi:general secretion pathway protein E/type IV pilus assembly protein PilB